MKATLKQDIISNCKGLQKYGSKGDPVAVLTWHDDVAIVEDKKGGRFPVRKEKLDYDETVMIKMKQANA